MAIQFDDRKIGVQPNGSLIKGFRTELPDTGAYIAKAGNNLGDAIGGIGLEFFKAENEKNVKDTANSTVFGKDENGALVRPPVPPNYGPASAKIFNDVIDGRYADQVVLDATMRFNEIQTNKKNDPVGAVGDMEAHSKGILSTVPPNIAGRIQGPLTREIAQRQHYMLLDNASRHNAAEAQDILTNTIPRFEDLARQSFKDSQSEGDAAWMQGQEYLKKARENGQRVAVLQGGYFNPATRAQDDKSIIASSGVMKVLSDKISNRAVTANELDTLSLILSGTDRTSSVNGINHQWVQDNIPSDRMRQHLIQTVQQQKGLLSSMMAQDAADAQYNAFLKPYTDPTAPFRGHLPGDLGKPEFQENAIVRWGKENLDPNKGEGVYTPAGAEKIIQQFGFYPEGLAKKHFQDIASMQPKDIDARVALYEQLQKGDPVGNTGSSVSNGLHSVQAKDAAFIEHYIKSRNSQVAEAAVVSARDAVKNNLPTPGNVGVGWITKHMENAGNTNITNEKVTKLFNGNFPWFSGMEMSKLSQEARDSLYYDAATRMSYGIEPEKAIAQSVNRFTKEFQRNESVMQTWTRNEQSVPTIIGPNGSKSADYTAGYVNQIVDPYYHERKAFNAEQSRTAVTLGEGFSSPAQETFVPKETKQNPYMLQGGYEIPGDAHYISDSSHSNVQLFANPNGTFQLFYTDPQGNKMLVVRRDNNAPVILNFDQAAKLQGNFIQSTVTANEEAKMLAKRDQDQRTQAMYLDPANGAMLVDAASTGMMPPEAPYNKPDLKPVEYAPQKLEDVVVRNWTSPQAPAPERLKKADITPPSKPINDAASTLPNATSFGTGDPKKDAINFILDHEGSNLTTDTNGAAVRFGVNKKSNPDVDVANLTRGQAADIYAARYWDKIGGDELAKKDPKLALVVMDTAAMSGTTKALKLLDESGGDPKKYMDLREAFLKEVAANPKVIPADQRANVEASWAKTNAKLRSIVNEAGAVPGRQSSALDAIQRVAPDGFVTPTNLVAYASTARMMPDTYDITKGLMGEFPDLKMRATMEQPAVPQVIDKTALASMSWQKFGQMAKVEGIIIHHTAGQGTVEGVINTFKQRNFPAHYIIDREGGVHQVLADNARGQHILPSAINNLSNANTIGVEIMGNNDADIKPVQVEAMKGLYLKLAQQHNLTADNVFGHGQVNPGHKQDTEGMSSVSAIKGMNNGVPRSIGNSVEFSTAGLSLDDKSRFVMRALQDQRVQGISYFGNDGVHIDLKRNDAYSTQKRFGIVKDAPPWFRNPVTEWLNG